MLPTNETDEEVVKRLFPDMYFEWVAGMIGNMARFLTIDNDGNIGVNGKALNAAIKEKDDAMQGKEKQGPQG